MSVDLPKAKHVRTVANNCVVSILNMSEAERRAHPTNTFAQEYNRTLMLAKEAMPEIASYRWPQIIPVDHRRREVFSIRHSELMVYFQTILSVAEDFIPSYSG